MFKKLKAFTMAEAILVMTILGIIATIMISTLKPAEYKEKSMQIMAKKVLSEIDVATTQIIMNDTVNGTLDELIEVGTSNVFTPATENAAYKFANLYKKYLTVIRKTAPEGYDNPGEPFLALKDGAQLLLLLTDATDGSYVIMTIFPGETEQTEVEATYGHIHFDINGFDVEPNVSGKDQFVLPLGPKGIKYAE